MMWERDLVCVMEVRGMGTRGNCYCVYMIRRALVHGLVFELHARTALRIPRRSLPVQLYRKP